MQPLRPYILPIAILLGLLLHRWCAAFAFLVPYVIFAILLLTFNAVELKRLRISWIDVWLMLFQVLVSTLLYIVIRLLSANTVLAEGAMMVVLCPVASSVAVVACMLGAKRETVTAYTIIGNLMVAIVAPIIFTLIGNHPERSMLSSMLIMLGKIAATLALPFALSLVLQLWLPRISHLIARAAPAAFYLWALALLFTLGQTIDFIFLHGQGNWSTIAWLAALSLLLCIAQFAAGRRIGRHYGDIISGGQLLGQKNSAMGIWMAGTFLSPLSSVALAFYSIYQNIFNAWQIAQHSKKKKE